MLKLNVLICGSTGYIGIQLVKELLSIKAKVSVVSLDRKHNLPSNVKFFKNVCDA